MLEGLRTQLASPTNVDLATAYLNPQGFALIADEVEQAGALLQRGLTFGAGSTFAEEILKDDSRVRLGGQRRGGRGP